MKKSVHGIIKKIITEELSKAMIEKYKSLGFSDEDIAKLERESESIHEENRKKYRDLGFSEEEIDKMIKENTPINENEYITDMLIPIKRFTRGKFSKAKKRLSIATSATEKNQSERGINSDSRQAATSARHQMTAWGDVLRRIEELEEKLIEVI